MSEQQRDMALRVNGQEIECSVPVRQSLADFLREDLGLRGTRLGCEHGVCGACTVTVGGEPVRACLMLAVQADGASVATIEGLLETPVMERLRDGFARHFATQCGFCTAGMLLSAHCLVSGGGRLDEEGVREALSGNLCRCTGYAGIVAAVVEASRG